MRLNKTGSVGQQIPRNWNNLNKYLKNNSISFINFTSTCNLKTMFSDVYFCVSAVSYTHLDVYKRQAYSSPQDITSFKILAKCLMQLYNTAPLGSISVRNKNI